MAITKVPSQRTKFEPYVGPYAALVNATGNRYGIDPLIIAAMLKVENAFKPAGTSRAGAEGISQILLRVHPEVSKAQADNPAFAIPWLGNYLAHLRDGPAGGSLGRAIRMYNVGPNADPRTLAGAGTAYLDQVNAAYRDLRRQHAATSVYPLGVKGQIIGVPYQGSHAPGATTAANWQSDNAIDIAVPVGTPVYAVGAGTIGPNIGPQDASNPYTAGQRLTLDTGNDAFFYGHLSKLVVKAGQKVQAGQLLGYSGEANGVAHLHLAEQATAPSSLGGHGAQLASATSGGKATPVSWWKKIVDGVIGQSEQTTRTAIQGLQHPGDLPKTLAGSLLPFDFTKDDVISAALWVAFMLVGAALFLVGLLRLFAPSRTPELSPETLDLLQGPPGGEG